MGQCEYADGFLDGYHCKNHYDDKVPQEMVKYYCTMHTQCDHCPWRGGDDWPRKKDKQDADWQAEHDRELAAKEAQKQQEAADRRARAQREQVDGGGSYHYSGGGGGGGSSSGGGGILGPVFGTFGLCIVITVAFLALCILGHWLGWTGPWVRMQIPSTAVTDDLQMYSVCQDGAHYFESRSDTFDKDGHINLRVHLHFSDIYLEQDRASVWIGLCGLEFLNTGTVYDYTYEEAEELMLRPLLIQLQDSKKAPLDGLSMEITDTHGAELAYIALGDGLYAVFLSNDAPNQSLTLQAAGYLDRHIPFKADARLSKVIVTME